MVYVDPLVSAKWRYGPACHLFADSTEELHVFARRIGMKRAWFQNNSVLPHYDLTISRRENAILNGAVELSRRELIAMIQKRRER